MDDRFPAIAAVFAGVALAAVGSVQYVLPGFPPPPLDPFVTGLLVVGTGVSLIAAGAAALRAVVDHLSLHAATAVGFVALVLAVLQPDALLFGGVFWLALVAAGLVVAGAYRTVSVARQGL